MATKNQKELSQGGGVGGIEVGFGILYVATIKQMTES